LTSGLKFDRKTSDQRGRETRRDAFAENLDCGMVVLREGSSSHVVVDVVVPVHIEEIPEPVRTVIIGVNELKL
jgi:hypothetical protein